MPESMDKYPFEDFPRRELANSVTRRQLLSALVTELHLYSKKDEGLEGIKLANLGTLSDNDLQDFIPAVIPGTKISVEDKAVWASTKAATQPACLFKIEPVTLYVFNLINGRNTIAEIARQLETHHAIPYDRAFSIARGMFLSFVEMGVCIPVNNPSAG